MGKGDQKTRRGKIQVGSFGVVRPRKKAATKAAAAKAGTDTKAPAKKASAKKTAAK
jgi:30S ribosomal protein S31